MQRLLKRNCNRNLRLAFFPVEMFEELIGCVERRIGGWHAAIDGGLQQHFLNLLARDADGKRGLEVHAKFLVAIERHKHGEREQTASLSRQARPTPDFAPGIAGDQVLERFIEFIAIFERSVYVRVAQYRAASLHAFVVSL